MFRTVAIDEPGGKLRMRAVYLGESRLLAEATGAVWAAYLAATTPRGAGATPLRWTVNVLDLSTGPVTIRHWGD